MKKLIWIAILFLVGCYEGDKEKSDSNAFKHGKNVAQLTNKKLKESSGIAASVINPGLLWINNDSGNPAEVYLVDKDLNIKLTCQLKNVKNRDWEDITTGPGPEPSKSYLYIGDIGDNYGRHDYKYIYRFEEPKLTGDLKKIEIVDFEKFTIQLDEPKDAETLMINPSTKDLYLVSKREDPVMLYKITFPYAPGDTIQAQKLFALPFTYIVGGNFSHNGKEVIMKNIQNVYYWKIPDDISADSALKTRPQILKYEKEPQGEAITFSLDGSGYYTISEKVRGEDSYLRFYERR